MRRRERAGKKDTKKELERKGGRFGGVAKRERDRAREKGKERKRESQSARAFERLGMSEYVCWEARRAAVRESFLGHR